MDDEVYNNTVESLEKIDTNDKFRFNRQAALLIYQGILDKDTLKKFLLKSLSKPLNSLYIVYDESRTYVIFELKKKINKTNPKFLDYLDIHPEIFKIKELDKTLENFKEHPEPIIEENYIVSGNFMNNISFNNKITTRIKGAANEDLICFLKKAEDDEFFRFKLQKAFLVYKTLINKKELEYFLDNITRIRFKTCYVAHEKPDKLMSYEHTNVLIDWGVRIDKTNKKFLDFNNIHPIIFKITNKKEWEDVCNYIRKSDFSIILKPEDNLPIPDRPGTIKQDYTEGNNNRRVIVDEAEEKYFSISKIGISKDLRQYILRLSIRLPKKMSLRLAFDKLLKNEKKKK